MPDFKITWEIDWPGATPKAALEAMMLDLFGGEWPLNVDHFVVTDENGKETAINYLSDDETKYECQNCGSEWAEDELEDLIDITERVAPGEPMPAGQCPDCGALCHEVEEADQEAL